jgi:aromatic-L-amino-acid/L-tryptophan decarboxylase
MSGERWILGDVPGEEFRTALARVAAWVFDYRSGIEGRRITPELRPGEFAERFPAELPDAPQSLDEILTEFETRVVPAVVHWGHPSFLGYFGSTTTAPGILGETLAAALNVSAMTWATSPAATELEEVVLKWIRSLVGLPAEFTGVVYDTASVAVLHALAAARESLGLDVRARGLAGRADLPVMRVYASEQAHSSVVKAAVTLGLGERNVRRVATDGQYRMSVGALGRAVAEDRREGFLPLAVVATVGTTSTAAVDPVPEVAALCRAEKIWLHVDAAYGGALGLLGEERGALAGVELADSLVVNPHKWMFVPLDFSALYARRPEMLRAVFSLVPEYLRGDAERGETNFMDYGVQLGRRFRALKAWMVFRAFGREGLAARVREHVRLAGTFARWVEGSERFELAAPVSMAVVCFRLKTAGGDRTTADALNRGLVARVNATGRAYLTHTELREGAALRLAVGNLLTTERHLREVFDLLAREAARS